jgi:hypothetical protein
MVAIFCIFYIRGVVSFRPPETSAYLTTSTDLVHWTKPTLVVTVAELSKDDPKGSWLYAYFSLLDPTAPDLNFSMIGDNPYVYFVRLDNNQ